VSDASDSVGAGREANHSRPLAQLSSRLRELAVIFACCPESIKLSGRREEIQLLLKLKRQSVRLALVQLVLMAAVVTAFVVDALSGIRARDGIHDDVEAIATNAMASVQWATRSRGDARRMNASLRDTVRATVTARPLPSTGQLTEVSRDLDASLTNYLSLETFPGEKVFYGELAAAKDEFERATAATVAAVEAHDVEQAQTRVALAQQASERLDAAIERVVDFNSEQAQQLGVRIESTRRDSDRNVLLGHGVVAILAMAATFSATVVLRQSWEALHERTTELDMFAGRVAHDLMSPLMAVSCSLGVVKTRLAGDPAGTAAVSRATRSLERVRALASGLLEYARAGASVPGASKEPTSVAETLRDVVEELQPEADAASVKLECALESRSRVRCPPGVLMSLTQNLVRNAIRHMGDKGCREVRVQAHDAEGFVHVDVEDTGPGVAPEILPRLFEPFARGPQASSGSGIGLSTVKKLAEAYGGRVGCCSRPDEGSVFWFELPGAAQA
jgi:signal transduction histidine kinase